jgi:hypothetical protein
VSRYSGQGNELSGSLKDDSFFDELNDCKLLSRGTLLHAAS